MPETKAALEYESQEDTPLKQAISRRMLTFFVIGDVLGAGIYALVGEVGGKTGGAIWSAFLFALALAVFTAFGGDYLSAFVSWDKIAVGLGFLAIVAIINLRGIKESMRFNFVLTMIEVSGLVLVVIIGAAVLGDGGGDPGRAFEFKAGESAFLAMIAGAGLAFFALIGFEDSVNLAEEAKKPRIDYPWALFGGLAVAGFIYLVVTIIASMVVPTDTLAGSDGPLLEVTSQGPLAVNDKVFSVIALFALANGALINMIMASRLMYGMSREGIVPGVFSKVLPGRQTPWVSIIFVTVIAAALLVTGGLEQLADTTVLLLLIVFAIVNVCVLILRRDKVEGKHFRAPTILPVIGAIVSVGLLTTKDGETFLRAAALLALGVILWLITWFTHGRHQEALDTQEMKTINDPR